MRKSKAKNVPKGPCKLVVCNAARVIDFSLLVTPATPTGDPVAKRISFLPASTTEVEIKDLERLKMKPLFARLVEEGKLVIRDLPTEELM